MHRFFSRNVSAEVQNVIKALSTNLYPQEQVEKMATDLAKFMMSNAKANTKVSTILATIQEEVANNMPSPTHRTGMSFSN